VPHERQIDYQYMINIYNIIMIKIIIISLFSRIVERRVRSMMNTLEICSERAMKVGQSEVTTDTRAFRRHASWEWRREHLWWF